jgi:hypothetical protein
MTRFFCDKEQELDERGRLLAAGAEFLEGVWVNKSLRWVAFVNNLMSVGLTVLSFGALQLELVSVAWVLISISVVLWLYGMWCTYLGEPRVCQVMFEVGGCVRISRGLWHGFRPKRFPELPSSEIAGIEVEESWSRSSIPMAFVRVVTVDADVFRVGLGLHRNEATKVARLLTVALTRVQNAEASAPIIDDDDDLTIAIG